MLKTFSLLAVCAASTAAMAAPATISLGGTQSTDGFVFNSTNYPGTGNFPGNATWGPLTANTAGSTDATIRPTAGSSYVATDGIYSGGISAVPNTSGSTLSVRDATPVSGVKTVVFQIDITEAFGYALLNNALPTLSYNGGTQALPATFSSLTQFDTGDTFPDPNDSSGNTLLPIYNDTYALQWDLSSIVGTIDSYSINFSPVQHSEVKDIQVDASSSVFSTSVVPEPASLALIGIGAIGVLKRRRS